MLYLSCPRVGHNYGHHKVCRTSPGWFLSSFRAIDEVPVVQSMVADLTNVTNCGSAFGKVTGRQSGMDVVRQRPGGKVVFGAVSSLSSWFDDLGGSYDGPSG